MTLVVGSVIDYVHFTVIVHPQFADYYVVNGGGNFPPSNVIRLTTHVRIVTFNIQMGRTQGNDLQIFATEFGRHAEFLPHFPTSSFAILRRYRWVMTDLKIEQAVFLRIPTQQSCDHDNNHMIL
jgi:hypothetical protein